MSWHVAAARALGMKCQPGNSTGHWKRRLSPASVFFYFVLCLQFLLGSAEAGMPKEPSDLGRGRHGWRRGLLQEQISDVLVFPAFRGLEGAWYHMA